MGRAKFATVASTGAMVVALLLIGTFGLITYQSQVVLTWLQQRVGEVEIFLDEDITENLAIALDARLQATPGIAETEYINREAAYQAFREDFGEEADIFDGERFIPPSIKVRFTPQYANLDSLSHLAAVFQTWEQVDDVVFNNDLLVLVQRNLELVRGLGLGVGILVVLAALFLVGNTIRLTIYARRLLIRTMKLVGATDAFIRRPFIIEGALQGVLAGGIAAALLAGLYWLSTQEAPVLVIDDPRWRIGLIAGVVFVGLLLGLIASLFAVRRFLRNVALH